ncbi:uroporphyrinogen-III C-methyltransferase / uroporphyrinogen-III synthase [Oscillochloris trichoides DG-6]|uniref:Uroporphyrinogen-III synthase n=1 Tax=Oscillochloris trichoides DG-6 TaxID=765420 RepID=E1IDF8_9CHLR|nr:uroporphyrinogen-III synthase [Oscillochloris trichoides]EFO80835.1 uroporphyrinogen-III C-methyltransferase / uroporphyrinogen-III synthase [Oscillochloris trichoides DG-6]
MSQPAALTPQPSALAGQRVVITRSAGKADGMATRLRELGAEPITYPTIAYVPPADSTALDAALARLVAGAYDWLLVTSAQVVRVLAERISFAQPPANLKVAAVGPATAKACTKRLGLTPATVPDQFIAEGLAASLGDLSGKRVLLPNADIARPVLEQHLRAAGAEVDRVIAYHTVTAPDNGVDMAAMLAAGEIAALTFTSGSTVRAFIEKVGPDAVALMQKTILACIGPATAVVCQEFGLEPQVVAEVYTEEGLLESLIAYMEVHP